MSTTTPKGKRRGIRANRMTGKTGNLVEMVETANELLEEFNGKAFLVRKGTQVTVREGNQNGTSGLVSDAIVTVIPAKGDIRGSVLVCLVNNDAIKASVASIHDSFLNGKNKFIATDVLDTVYLGYIKSITELDVVYGVNMNVKDVEEFEEVYPDIFNKYLAVEEIASGELADITTPKGTFLIDVSFLKEDEKANWELKANLNSLTTNNAYNTPNSQMEVLDINIKGTTKVILDSELPNPQMGIPGGPVIRPLVTLNSTSYEDASIGEMFLAIGAISAMTDKGVVYECLMQAKNYGILNILPPLNVTNGKLKPLELNSPKLSKIDRDMHLSNLIKGNSMLAIEAEEMSAESIAMNTFVAAANGDSRAIESLVNSVTTLAPGIVIPQGGMFDGVATLPNGTHMDGTVKNINALDIADVIGVAPDLDRLWISSELPGQDAYISRITALARMGINADIDSRCFRVYFKPEFISNLLIALKQNGLTVAGSEQMAAYTNAQSGYAFAQGAFSQGTIVNPGMGTGAQFHGHGIINGNGHNGFVQYR